MGIFEEFKNLFKSTREMEKEQKRAARRNNRELERQIDTLNEQIEKKEAEKKKVWASAVKALKEGGRMGANRLLIEYKMIESDIHKLMIAKRFAQTKQNKATYVQNMKDLSDAIANVANEAENADPDEIAEKLDAASEAMDNSEDIAKVMEQACAEDEKKFMANLEKAKLDDTIDNDLMKALEREVVAEMAGGDLPAQSISETATFDEQINADLNRLNAQNQEQ